MERKLVFFVDPAWRKTGVMHIPLLFPFWGNAFDKKKLPFYWQLFEKRGFDTNLYTITDEEANADAILAPHGHAHLRTYAPDVLESCIEASRKSGKPLLVDGIGDIEYPFNAPHAYILRYGGYRFEKREDEIHIPPYADDLLEAFCGGELRLRQKSEKPSISFSGWAGLTFTQEIKATLKEFPDRVRGVFDDRYGAKKKGVFFRQHAMRILRGTSLVETHFLTRRSYSGHGDTAEKRPEELRKEFVDNLLESDYALDIRGDANASVRLYEILSLGRIPVILDTERNFPFSEKVNYRDFSFIVDFRDIKRLPELLSEFHASLTEEQFIRMQKAAREAYLTYFRVDALTKYLMEEIHFKIKGKVE